MPRTTATRARTVDDDRRRRSARSRPASRTTPSTSPRPSPTSSAGPRRTSACPTSSTRSWPSSRSSTGSTASGTSSCSRCTRRTARATASSRRSSSRTIWPEFIAALEAGDYGNKLFVSLRLVDFTPGYDTNSAVLFPETVAMREIPTFTWGAIFQDREAARYRRVMRAASEITKLDLPDERRARCSTTRRWPSRRS